MAMPATVRRCRCGTRLARDNQGDECRKCCRSRTTRQGPPDVPVGFWAHETIRAALRQENIGKVLAAYRKHPHHGRNLPQHTVAEWLGISQTNLSKIEQGTQVITDLTKLTRWASTLGVPEELLWFANPTTEHALAPRKAATQAPRESLDFLAWVNEDRIAASTLEHVANELRRTAADYVHKPLVPLFVELVELRDTLTSTLQRRSNPRQSRESLFLIGTICSLLAHASQNLGCASAARAQAATAWACAEQANHDDLRAWVRGTQALIAEWNDEHTTAVTLAQEGSQYATSTDSRVRLIAIEARSRARDGDAVDAINAVRRADRIREQPEHQGELAALGGILSFPYVKQRYYAGSTFALAGRYAEAEAAALDAIRLYETGPTTQRSYGDEALARMDVALARTAEDDLDGTRAALSAVLDLPASRRIEQVTTGLGRVRTQLDTARYAHTSAARELAESITAFTQRSARPSLPGGTVGFPHAGGPH